MPPASKSRAIAILAAAATLETACGSAPGTAPAALSSTTGVEQCQIVVADAADTTHEFRQFRLALPSTYRVDETSVHLAESRLWVAADSSMFLLELGDSRASLDDTLTEIVADVPCSLLVLGAPRYVEQLRITTRDRGSVFFVARSIALLSDTSRIAVLVAGRSENERAALLGRLSRMSRTE